MTHHTHMFWRRNNTDKEQLRSSQAAKGSMRPSGAQIHQANRIASPFRVQLSPGSPSAGRHAERSREIALGVSPTPAVASEFLSQISQYLRKSPRKRSAIMRLLACPDGPMQHEQGWFGRGEKHSKRAGESILRRSGCRLRSGVRSGLWEDTASTD